MSETTKTAGGFSPVMTPVRPGLRYGPAPQRRQTPYYSSALDRWLVRARSRLTIHNQSASTAWLSLIKTRIAATQRLSPFQRQADFRELANSVRAHGHDALSLERSLSYAVLAARHALELDPHDVQLIAVQALFGGSFVEMATGEGKTLTMALAAVVSALDGTPVHVLTSSDYLAQRDAGWLSSFYRVLGVSAAYVVSGMSDDERRAAYRADVVHVTGKQVAFDWLRDGVGARGSRQGLAARLGPLANVDTDGHASRHEPLLRGLCLAIVDEADSLLVDEARTPLVLSAPTAEKETAREECIVALTLARLLHEGVDFTLLPGARFVAMTPEGERSLDTLATRFDGLWRAARFRDEKVREALLVLHCWHRDRDYVVRDNRVELVDPHTGRALPDRRLQQGLHRLLELKERCDPTPENDVVASLPFQQYFRHYVRLSGMSGTLHEIRDELASVYGVKLVRVPLQRPSRLRFLPQRFFATKSRQLEALVEEVQYCLLAERPVLVGTRTVEQSEQVSTLLSAQGIAHHVLNASQDANEAAVVAEAGIAGQVTVATNMAGRGTDIRLGAGVKERGGLHVIALAFNESRRLDRQLAGRAGRQGEPGSYVRFVCFEDDALVNESPQWMLRGMKRLLTLCDSQNVRHTPSNDTSKMPLGYQNRNRQVIPGNVVRAIGMSVAQCVAKVFVQWIQRRIECRHADERQRALQVCKQLRHQIAIGDQGGFSL